MHKSEYKKKKGLRIRTLSGVTPPERLCRRANGMSSESVTACAKAFCEVIAQAGYTPLIYFNCETGYFNYDLSLVKDIGFWLAEYYDTPSFYYNYKMWQYTKTGTVAGINGAVDLNISVVDFSGSAVG